VARAARPRRPAREPLSVAAGRADLRRARAAQPRAHGLRVRHVEAVRDAALPAHRAARAPAVPDQSEEVHRPAVPQHLLLHVASRLPRELRAGACHAHRRGLDDGAHRRSVHFVQGGDDAALVRLAREVRCGGVRGEVAPHQRRRVEAEVLADVRVAEPAPAQKHRRQERAARGDGHPGAHLQRPHDRQVRALRCHADAPLRLDVSVLTASTGANPLQQQLLGLALGKDHRAAAHRVDQPRGVRTTLVPGAAPIAAVVALRRVPHHRLHLVPERLAPLAEHLVLKPLLGAPVRHADPLEHRVHGGAVL
jgi:hypothetical protein